MAQVVQKAPAKSASPAAQAKPADPMAGAPEGKKMKWWVWLIIVVVVILIAAGLYYWLAM